jgi:hypothetical protein
MTDRREWHLDKSLSVGHILTTLLILGALSVQYAQFTARLAVLETNYQVVGQQIGQVLDNQRRVDIRQDQEIRVVKEEINKNLERLADRLDELARQR